ncbi:hypothetical protein [Alkaliphilus peptidifermentans]|uniref:Uncharacterized protein n=1 Tax=Alkaliphilus peptidifermentans DSM 18978 TaxID=1120976 RepID=A0A1G5L7Z7_9FIRM|nr:hypothetical protein [Alkaliphilus peptidifermentans]SCZ08400.1 hypothetical protein SAMN03080606_04112 [Alkaliphilus peptidifermentans DSM 18978]
MKKSKSIWERIQPWHIFSLTLLYLVVAWLLSYFIDIRNIFNLQRYIQRFDRGFLWFQLFKEAQITEMLQWTFLGASVLLCGFIWGKLSGKGSKYTAKFFMFLGIGLAIMFMEDAGNVRHNIKEYTYFFFGRGQTVATLTELAFYSVLGAIMMFAIIKYGTYIWHSKKTRFYLIIGFVSYGVISIASATRDINDWYLKTGDWLHQVVLNNAMAERFYGSVGFFLMDFLIEESVELIGASALFTALFSFLIFINNNEGYIDKKFNFKI